MKKNTILSLSSVVLSVLFVTQPVCALSVSTGVSADASAGTGTGASVTANATVDAKLATRIATAKDHADQEIDRRITALNALNTRVEAMVRLTADQKTNISSFIQTQVTAMTDLKTKIAADTDITSLKTDIKSITDSYRIFMLIVPQGHVIATADAMVSTSDTIAALGVKLQARITDAQTAGKDVTQLTALLTDLNAKAADAKVQAQDAVTIVGPLQPDGGDKTVMAANAKAFADARAKIKAGRADLSTARNDAQKIVIALKAMKLDASASMNASSTTSTQ